MVSARISATVSSGVMAVVSSQMPIRGVVAAKPSWSSSTVQAP